MQEMVSTLSKIHTIFKDSCFVHAQNKAAEEVCVVWIESVIMHKLKWMNFRENDFHVLSYYYIEPADFWLHGKTLGESTLVYLRLWNEEKLHILTAV